MANTTNYKFNLPIVGGSQNSWGTDLNENWSKLDSLLYGVSYTDSDTNTVERIRPDLDQNSWAISGAIVTASATELNKIDGYSGTTSDLNILSGAASAGVTSTAFRYLSGASSNLQTQINSVIPSGVILLWSGSTSNIPTGWVLCDGQNSTPDLRDRFVVGAGSTYAVDATGGEASVTLTSDQIPAHNHSATSTVTDPGHSHTTSGRLVDSADGGSDDYVMADLTTTGSTNDTQETSTSNSATTGVSVSTSIGNTGGGQSHENRPPYYALAYIMKS